MMARNEETLTKARAKILESVPDAFLEIHPGDTTSEADVRAALARAHAISGTVDILVPAVGGSDTYYPILLETTEHFHAVLNRNLLSAFLIIRDGAPLMQPNGGSIVCVSTTTVVQQCEGLASYVASKAGLERLVKMAALELGGAQIRVNSVRPGMTRSAATEFMYSVPGVEDLFSAATPLGRTGEPEDVARAIRFLAGPESGWVNGQNFAADGGQELTGIIPDFLDEAYGEETMALIRAGKLPETTPAPAE
jgi:NAD(P)-dependent dehydrogenase (short-subunit alcohol dehydrogenase family)